MCGFLISKRPDADNSFIRRRGPDTTRTITVGEFHFTHNLLHITGTATAQPFVDRDVVCLYNGEIYNHPYEVSDGEVLIPLYREYGDDFVRHLDGEFAVALYDFARGVAIFATDPFASKPLWRNGAQAASYQSGVGGLPVAPDTVVTFDLSSGSVRERRLGTFDFARQHKDSFDDWIDAFERAVAKRAYDGGFLNLSAGYDSGAIDCALTRLGTRYKTYSIEGRENLDILRARNGSGPILRITKDRVARERELLRAFVEPYTYRVSGPDGTVIEKDLLDDRATAGLSVIYALANEEQRRVNLSGQGADEILCDYSRSPEMTHLHGRFPEALEAWPNFSGNYQRAYLAKEEHLAGAYGIETRYPFLDRQVVQEFFWLTADLKNRRYKAPLHEYLTRNGYPFETDSKTGFQVTSRAS